MITSRSPNRSMARAWRRSSQSCATCSSSRWCSAARAVSYPSDSWRITRSRRSETSSISCLISISVRISVRTTAPASVFLRIPELVEPVLVDAEVVGELVQDRDPDLLGQFLRVGKGGDERPAVDRDLVGQVRLRLPEAEQIRVVGVLLGHDDRDVLERPREVRGQRIERRGDLVGEAHQRGRSGGRVWKRRSASSPKRKPPTCAAKATPPPPPGCVTEKPPCQSWKTNQSPRKTTAEIGTGRKPNRSVTTRAWGRRRK